MKKDILIFGDSIAYGIGDPILGGWVDLFKRYMWENNSTKNVYNFCIDGNSTREILQRISIQSAQTLYEKEMIFIAIGINDSIKYKDGTNFMSKIEFKDNLEKIIQLANAFTKNIIFIGLTQVDESKTAPFPESRTGKSFTNNRIKEFDDVLRETVENKGVKYIPMFDLLDNSDMFDGLHVNTIGQKKMFVRIVEKLKL